jgi:hypothetical protein
LRALSGRHDGATRRTGEGLLNTSGGPDELQPTIQGEGENVASDDGRQRGAARKLPRSGLVQQRFNRTFFLEKYFYRESPLYKAHGVFSAISTGRGIASICGVS